MITTITAFRGKPGMESLLVKTLKEYSRVIKEKNRGCVMSIPHVDVEHRSVFILIEKWADQNVYETYLKSEYHIKTDEKFNSMLLDQPQTHFLEELS